MWRFGLCLLGAAAELNQTDSEVVHREAGLHDIVWLITLAVLFVLVVLGIYGFNAIHDSFSREQAEKAKQIQNADEIMRKVVGYHSMKYQAKAPVDHLWRGIPKVLEAGTSSIGVEWNEIECRKKADEEALLKIRAGGLKSNQLTGIMGPSGSGKSMLMEIIAGKRRSDRTWDVDEDVLFVQRGGAPVERKMIKRIMAFVPQEDLVHEFLTVRENIYFSASKRLRGHSLKHVDKVTDDVLRVLQLVHVQNHMVGNRLQSGSGLSGGQKKRVSVGLELAACPRLLFLDEPTSSLDSLAALQLVQHLKKIAELGVTVVMVIHQPRYDLFRIMDELLLLSNGRLAYNGPTLKAQGHFNALGLMTPANMNPADWMIDILCGQNLSESLPETFDATSMPDVPDYVVQRWEDGGLQENRAIDRLEQQLPKLQRAITSAVDPATAETLLRRLATLTTSSSRSSVAAESMQTGTLVDKLWRHWDEVLKGELSADQVNFRKVLASLLPQEEVSQHAAQKIMEDALQGQVGPLKRVDFMNLVLRWENHELEVFEPAHKDDPPVFRSWSSSSSESEEEDQEDDDLCWSFYNHLLCTLQVSVLQLDRGWKTELGFLSVVAAVGAGLSLLSVYIFQDPIWSPNSILNVQTAQAFLISIYSLRVFSVGREMYWREASRGLNRLAFFIGRALVNDLGLGLQTAVYVGACYVITYPSVPFLSYLLPFVLVTYVSCGWGFAVSCCLSSSMGPFTCSIIAFVTGGILGMPPQMGAYLDGSVGEILVGCLSYTRWSVDMTFEDILMFSPPDKATLQPADKLYLDLATGSYGQASFILPGDTNHQWTCVLAMLTQGLLLRLAAYLGLRFKDQARQA